MAKTRQDKEDRTEGANDPRIRVEPSLIQIEPTAPPGEEGIELGATWRLVDYLEELWRWRWFLALTSLLVALVLLVMTARMPNVFRSQARLMVSAPREDVDATRVIGLRRGHTPFSPAASAMAILASRDLAERVANRLGPAEILAPAIPSSPLP